MLKKVSGFIELGDDLTKHETAEGHRTEPANIEQNVCHCVCTTFDQKIDSISFSISKTKKCLILLDSFFV